MNYLHQRWHNSVSVVHRDLKPDNIGFTSNGILKVFDFGLCACIKSNLQNKESKYAMTGNTGTLRYMAPEVALGECYNQSVDVYSFGIITWQIMKGRIPFEEMNKKTFFEKVVRGKYRPQTDNWWSKDLCKLLESCWHHDYRRRPSFVEVMYTLDHLIEKSKKGYNCFCISQSIPVLFSNGFICLDPEFIAKYRISFVAFPSIFFCLGVIYCHHARDSQSHLFLIGVSFIFSTTCVLYAIVYLSWEYWPSLSLKVKVSLPGIKSNFYSYSQENIEIKYGEGDDENDDNIHTQIANAGNNCAKTSNGNKISSNESPSTLSMSSFRYTGVCQSFEVDNSFINILNVIFFLFSSSISVGNPLHSASIFKYKEVMN